MSVATEITRITQARNTIRSKLIELGMAQNTDTLNTLAVAVEGIENRGAVSAIVQAGDTYTIPKGYHNGSGTVSATSGSENYNLQSKSVTPTKIQQNVTPDSGYYGLDSVTVAPIPENYQDVSTVTAEAADVLTGKVFVDATGTAKAGAMPNNGAISQTIDGLTATSVTIPAGYVSGGTVSLSGDIEEALAAI